MSDSDIKKRVKDIKASEFEASQPIDVAIINGKMISDPRQKSGQKSPL